MTKWEICSDRLGNREEERCRCVKVTPPDPLKTEVAQCSLLSKEALMCLTWGRNWVETKIPEKRVVEVEKP